MRAEDAGSSCSDMAYWKSHVSLLVPFFFSVFGETRGPQYPQLPTIHTPRRSGPSQRERRGLNTNARSVRPPPPKGSKSAKLMTRQVELLVSYSEVFEIELAFLVDFPSVFFFLPAW